MLLLRSGAETPVPQLRSRQREGMTAMRDGPAARARIAWKAFGKDIRSVRTALNVGLREFAGLVGMSPATLSRAERGLAVDPVTFVWLCDWAGHDPRDYLAPLYTKAR